MRLTKLGYAVVIHPCFYREEGSTQWELVMADQNGNWASGSIHTSKAAATKERTRLFRLHRQLCKKRKPRHSTATAEKGE